MKPIFLETIKVKDGMYYNLGLHMSRMERATLHFFNKKVDVDFNHYPIPRQLQSGLVKCRLTYSSEIISIEYEPYQIRCVSKLAIIENSEIDYQFKYQDRSILNTLLLAKKGADDILIAKKGLITDTSYSNVVFKDENENLFTPANPLLKGIKRQALLNSNAIAERDIRIEDISAYTGLYIINSMIDIEDNIFIKSENLIR